jgi:hypothetical protein
MIAQPFTLPDDGWFQISAIGDFPHATTGLVQVIDADAVSAIVQKFAEESAKPNFPGVLVDWDHASLDLDKPTEAAGWIMNLQQRPDGLWGQVRWSDRGAEAISGGRYRFMSPVWRQEDCLALGEKKVRPLRLFNCALTNDPNIKGMVPLANSGRVMTDEQRRAMYARMGPRGGGGGDATPVTEGGYVQTPTGWQLAPESAPSQPTPEPVGQPTSPKLAGLQKIKDELNGYRTPRPVHPGDPREQIDTRAMKYQMMREGKPLNEISAATAEAERQNKERRDELRELKDSIADRFKDPDARDRALAKEIEARDRAFSDAVQAWEDRNELINKEVRRTEVAMAEEQTRLEAVELRTKSAAEQRAYQEEKQRARDQVARDKEAARQAEAERRREEQNQRQVERDRQANEPTKVYRGVLTKRRTYWDALSRGDKAYAERIFPGADHQKNAEAMKTVSGWKDKAKQLRDTEPR